MEEESEDIAFYQLAMKHLKILCRVLWSFPFTYASKLLSGQALPRTSKLEVVLAAFAVLSTVLVLYQAAELVRRWYAPRLRRLVPSKLEFARARDSWELVRGDCGVYALQGRRPRMEDRFSVAIEGDIALYGIFDGHGGEFAAEYAEKHLFKDLLKKMQIAVQNKNGSCELTDEFVRLLTKEILDLDLELLSKVKASRDVAGTTALVAIVYKTQLIVANVGDSRGVICDAKGNTIPLSFDHKPDQIKERQRIKEAGGFIAYNGVWRVAGILATSRALGDFPLKDRNLVIARPDILTFDLSDLNPQFMILATDGLWDTFSNEDAVAFIKDYVKSDRLKGARNLALQAFKKGSSDNVTVLVVSFKTHIKS